MLIRHPTSGLFWSVNDAREVSLTKEGSVYVKTTCDVPPHLFHFDDNTSHLKNTVTGKCVCRIDNKLVEADHAGIHNGLFEWTIVDGMIQNFQGPFVDGDLSLVDKTEVQWNVADSFEENEDDVPVNRAAALIEEALNAQAELEEEPEVAEPEPEVTPEIDQAIADTVADVLVPAAETPITEEVDEVEA